MTGSTSKSQQGHDNEGEGNDGNVSSSVQPIGPWTLAEDVLAAPRALPANDPVRVETAAASKGLRDCEAVESGRGSW